MEQILSGGKELKKLKIAIKLIITVIEGEKKKKLSQQPYADYMSFLTFH